MSSDPSTDQGQPVFVRVWELRQGKGVAND